MEEIKKGYVFLTVGKTVDSAAQSFSRYVGIGTSRIIAYNPTKEQLDEIMGYESQFEPEYIKEENGEKVVNIHIIVQTVPEQCNGIDIKTKAMFTLRPKAALSSNGESVQVIDDYGNYAWANYADAKAGKTLPANKKIDQSHYRIACDGEVDLTVFFKKFLGVPNSLDYANGVWTVKKDAENAVFRLDVKELLKGNFSDIKEAIELQPNNTIKLLYGVKTKEDGKQQQVVCTGADFTMRSNASQAVIAKVEKDLASTKSAGKYSNIEYSVQDLTEYKVTPTNLASPAPAAAPAVSDDFWNS